jgi:hypothetical protein
MILIRKESSIVIEKSLGLVRGLRLLCVTLKVVYECSRSFDRAWMAYAVSGMSFGIEEGLILSR